MRIWKQGIISLVLIGVAGGGWLVYRSGFGPASPQTGAASPNQRTADKNAASRGETQQSAGQTRDGQRGAGRNGPVLVATQSVDQRVVNDQLHAIGTSDAIRSVAVMPQAVGTIREILIKSGDKVEQGQVLVRLDNEEQIIARGQADVALKSAKEKSDLYQNIRSSVSRLEVFDAKSAEQAAILQLQAAELNLKRRDVTAPIAGIVGIVPVVVGDNVSTASTIVTLDDRSEILVDYWVPERFANSIEVGQPIKATSVALPGQVFSGTVAAVDNRLDAASRTLHIRAQIENTDDRLRAGMSFDIAMTFPGDPYPAVSPLAVQWDSQGAFVWQVKDEKSVKTRVSIVQRNADAVLIKADLQKGDVIVTEGLQRVRDGGNVRIAGAANNTKVALE